MPSALGAALVATQGEAAPEVAQTDTRAPPLCEPLDKPQQLVPVLRGWHTEDTVRAELQTAHALGEPLLTLAQQSQESVMLGAAHRVLGTTVCYAGAIADASTHFAQGRARYAFQQHRASVVRSGEETGVWCSRYAALALWYVGDPDQGLPQPDQALTLVQQRRHPLSLGHAVSWAALFHPFRRAVRCTQERAEAALSLATDQGCPSWMAVGALLRGWALAPQEQGKEGIEQLPQGLMTSRATGAGV